jgi:hypothetical protein
LNIERGAAALFMMLDAFITGSPLTFGEIEDKEKATRRKLAKVEIAYAKAVTVREASGRAQVSTAGARAALVAAGLKVVELGKILTSLKKTLG